MKISCKHHRAANDSHFGIDDFEVIVEENGFRGHAMMPLRGYWEPMADTCKRVIEVVNMAIGVLERKKLEKTTEVEEAMGNAAKKHAEDIERIWWMSEPLYFCGTTQKIKFTDLVPGQILMAPTVCEEVVFKEVPICTCEITAHGKVDNPECPECFSRRNSES